MSARAQRGVERISKNYTSMRIGARRNSTRLFSKIAHGVNSAAALALLSLSAV